jgi:hypothetical protein
VRENKGRKLLTDVVAGETGLKLSQSLKNPCTKKGKRASIKYSRIQKVVRDV